MIGGYFKFHWLDPQKITVKIDDPASPLTAMFKAGEFDINDEIYTMAAKSWSRDNVHVLTSIDYAKMSPADRALEEHPRPDHDFGLSWIRREGQGRVFYEALGHSERIYAIEPMPRAHPRRDAVRARRFESRRCAVGAVTITAIEYFSTRRT